MTNITNVSAREEDLAEIFRVLGQPVRIQILLVIGCGEACVCHLEAYLGQRQAAISQHLMVLRDAGLVKTHRVGRNIFYRLNKPGLLDLVRQTMAVIGKDIEPLELALTKPVSPCPCPYCDPDGALASDCSQWSPGKVLVKKTTAGM